jgi:hypothetical protein
VKPLDGEESSWKALVQSDRVDYDRDPIKHYIRVHGWLPPSTACAASIAPRRVRYFTFCAANAVDVFMLEQAGILQRDANGRLRGTFFCEADAEAFEEIVQLIRSADQGFLGRFEDIVLFDDSPSTFNRTYTDPGPGKITERLRERLRIKDLHEKMRAAFPFDLINLDATGTLLPPNQGAASDLVKAIMRVIAWQGEALLPNGGRIDQFSLFLTAEVDNSALNYNAIGQLISLVNCNLEQMSGFRDCWERKFGASSVDELARARFPEFFPVAFVKAVVENSSRLGWDVASDGRFLYRRMRRGATYRMMSEVLTFHRVAPAPVNSLFDPTWGISSVNSTKRVIEVVQRAAVWADDAVSIEAEAGRVGRHLRGVREFRENVLTRFDV